MADMTLPVGFYKYLTIEKCGRVLHQGKPNCKNQKWAPSWPLRKKGNNFVLHCKSLPLGCVHNVKYMYIDPAVQLSRDVSWK